VPEKADLCVETVHSINQRTSGCSTQAFAFSDSQPYMGTELQLLALGYPLSLPVLIGNESGIPEPLMSDILALRLQNIVHITFFMYPFSMVY